MERQGVTSFKAYMAYDALRLSDAEIEALFAATRDIGVVACTANWATRSTKAWLWPWPPDTRDRNITL
jgi:hypothetical protein